MNAKRQLKIGIGGWTMSEKLYYIANRGCDATTYGLARISDEDFPKFKTFIENLNKNSYYGCMPTISVYEISADELREFEYDPKKDCFDDDYVESHNILYLDGKTYTFVKEYGEYDTRKCVICHD